MYTIDSTYQKDLKVPDGTRLVKYYAPLLSAVSGIDMMEWKVLSTDPVKCVHRLMAHIEKNIDFYIKYFTKNTYSYVIYHARPNVETELRNLSVSSKVEPVEEPGFGCVHTYYASITFSAEVWARKPAGFVHESKEIDGKTFTRVVQTEPGDWYRYLDSVSLKPETVFYNIPIVEEPVIVWEE